MKRFNVTISYDVLEPHKKEEFEAITEAGAKTKAKEYFAQKLSQPISCIDVVKCTPIKP